MYLVKEDGLQFGRCRPLNTMRTFRIADVDRSDRRPRREPQQGGAELWLMSVRQAAAIRTKVVAVWAHSRRHYHGRRDHHRRHIQSAVANAAAIWAAVKAQPTKVAHHRYANSAAVLQAQEPMQEALSSLFIETLKVRSHPIECVAHLL
jgi:hypothetical protein